jgi:NAD(P)-dependent dehydrogenase (short-subunit alcohol dehydrogenase family)
MTPKTWFIAGASNGFGREWALAALERGDRVAIAARRTALLEEIAAEYGDAAVPITVDATDRAAMVEAVARAHRHLGRLDVVVNCTGGGHFGAVEEVTRPEVQANLDRNYFTAIWVAQAALPYLRAQGSGHLVMVSSVGGLIGISSLGIYCASKWALEGMCEALAAEVARFGVRVTIVEPAGYRTNPLGRATSAPHPDYAAEHELVRERVATVAAGAGDPAATRAAILQLVDADDPPLRLLLGAGSVDLLGRIYEARLATWREWAEVSNAAHGAAPAHGGSS